MAVEEISRKQVIAIIVAIVLVAVSAGYILVSSRPRLMSALEAREIADQAALEWDGNVTLCSVMSIWEYAKPDAYAFWNWPDSNAYAQWCFGYYLPTTVMYYNVTFHPRLDVFVFSNKSCVIGNDTNLPLEVCAPFSNWTVDNADAFDIALGMPEIDTCTQENQDARVFYLMNAYEYPNRTIWNITFGEFVNPIADIHIDANTGEVLRMKVYDYHE